MKRPDFLRGLSLKIKSRRGESLTEALVSVLIIALASAMLFTAVNSAVKTMNASDKKITTLNTQLTEAEIQDSEKSVSQGDVNVVFTKNGSLTETVSGYSVSFYGGDTLISYSEN